MVGGEALQPPALLQFPGLPVEQKLSRCHKTLATMCGFPRTKHLPAASPFPNPTCPWTTGTCRPADLLLVRCISAGRGKRRFLHRGKAEPMRKVLIRLCLKLVGWQGSAGRANRKPGVPAGKSPTAGSPL